MKTREHIDQEIARLKREIEHTEGTPTEVYSRIVGYYRSVKNWNRGKRQEFDQRIQFDLPEDHGSEGSPSSHPKTTAERTAPPSCPEHSRGHLVETQSYLFFFRRRCPNCPPMKQYLETVDMPGRHVDVDTEEGMDLAQTYEIFASPTVVLVDEDGGELGRAAAPNELEPLFEAAVFMAS
jgi:ribonucleoside-triphosphate reductase